MKKFLFLLSFMALATFAFSQEKMFIGRPIYVNRMMVCKSPPDKDTLFACDIDIMVNKEVLYFNEMPLKVQFIDSTKQIYLENQLDIDGKFVIKKRPLNFLFLEVLYEKSKFYYNVVIMRWSKSDYFVYFIRKDEWERVYYNSDKLYFQVLDDLVENSEFLTYYYNYSDIE